MNDELSNDNNVDNDNKDIDKDLEVETNFDDLLSKARQIPQFEKYNDIELKEKLLNLVFSLDSSDKIDELDNLTIEQTKERKIHQIISELEKSLREDKNREDKEVKKKILERKKKSLSSLKDSLPILYDKGSLHFLLFKLAKEIDAYHNKLFWDFNHYSQKDFIKFTKEASQSFYHLKTNAFVKIWDILLGQRVEKIENSNPLKQISIYPKEKRDKIYGTNYFRSNLTENGWALLCFKSSQPIPELIPIEKSFAYSIKDIVSSLSKIFDDIFSWTNIKFSNQFLDTTNDSLNGGSVRNAGLFFKLISESFIPVIKIFTFFEHIAKTLPQTENHPFASSHLIYFLAWVYIRWISFLEKALYDKKNYVTPEGETGLIFLQEIFVDIETEMDNELVSVDIEEGLGAFHNYFSEREEILKKIDHFKILIPELKRKIKILLSNLILDSYSDFFEKKGFYFRGSVDPKGGIHFNHALRKKGNSLFDKLLSLFQGKTKSPQLVESQEAREPVVPSQSTSLSTTTIDALAKKEYRVYNRAVDDLLTLLSAIINSFNENFSPENQFKLTPDSQRETLDYLSENPYFMDEDKAPFNLVIGLQTCYNIMFEVKILGEEIIQGIKNNEDKIELINKSAQFDESISILLTSIKDSSGTLGVFSEANQKYQEYGILLNKFQFVYKEFQRVNLTK